MLKLFLGTVAGAAWGGGGSIGLEIATAGVGGVGGTSGCALSWRYLRVLKRRNKPPTGPSLLGCSTGGVNTAGEAEPGGLLRSTLFKLSVTSSSP